jgi:undecaprenyl pyrophosphate phosphatase UppP
MKSVFKILGLLVLAFVISFFGLLSHEIYIFNEPFFFLVVVIVNFIVYGLIYLLYVKFWKPAFQKPVILPKKKK